MYALICEPFLRVRNLELFRRSNRAICVLGRVFFCAALRAVLPHAICRASGPEIFPRLGRPCFNGITSRAFVRRRFAKGVARAITVIGNGIVIPWQSPVRFLIVLLFVRVDAPRAVRVANRFHEGVPTNRDREVRVEAVTFCLVLRINERRDVFGRLRIVLSMIRLPICGGVLVQEFCHCRCVLLHAMVGQLTYNGAVRFRRVATNCIYVLHERFILFVCFGAFFARLRLIKGLVIARMNAVRDRVRGLYNYNGQLTSGTASLEDRHVAGRHLISVVNRWNPALYLHPFQARRFHFLTGLRTVKFLNRSPYKITASSCFRCVVHDRSFIICVVGHNVSVVFFASGEYVILYLSVGDQGVNRLCVLLH